MKVVLDTHILHAIIGGRLSRVSPGIARIVAAGDVRSIASVVSLWEIAIKTRLGKLDPGMPLSLFPLALDAAGISLLSITPEHALATVEPMPRTRDPFDRMLLAQCHVESCRLATLDRALRDHPLAVHQDGSRASTPKNPKTRR